MNTETATPEQPRLEIQKIYLKDASLECPSSPDIFRNNSWEPQANLQLGTESTQLAERTFEVTLSTTLTVKNGESTSYLVEVQQAGIFTVEGVSDEQLGPMLGIACPNILFPFAREAVADLIMKAGFPQHVLPPVNFEALFAQQAQQKAPDEAQASGHTSH